MTEITGMEVGEILRNRLQEAGADQLREMVQMFAEALMGADADGLCGSSYGERPTERVNYRNGYRRRRWGAGRAPAEPTRRKSWLNALPVREAPAGAALPRVRPRGRPPWRGSDP